MLKELLLNRAIFFELHQKLCNNYKAVGKEFEDYLKVRDKDILDIGCSTGTCAAAAVPMRDNRYVGIDIVPQYVELARKRNPHGQFLTMSAEQLSFPDSSFDIVLFIGVLHHMPTDLIQRCFKEVRRVLRSDGVVLCAEPVFTRGMLLSTILLSLDRGDYIRDEPGYRSLFSEFRIVRQSYFRFTAHRLSSYVLAKDSVALARCA